MKGALRHPLVAGFLDAIRSIGLARAALPQNLPVRAADLGIDRLWKPGRTWPVPRRGNGSAKVRRAAVKARNRRAHRAKAR